MDKYILLLKSMGLNHNYGHVTLALVQNKWNDFNDHDHNEKNLPLFETQRLSFFSTQGLVPNSLWNRNHLLNIIAV